MVERRNCLRLLEAPGRAILIVLGGAAEAPYTQRGCCDLVLRKRCGRVAIPALPFLPFELFLFACLAAWPRRPATACPPDALPGRLLGACAARAL